MRNPKDLTKAELRALLAEEGAAAEQNETATTPAPQIGSNRSKVYSIRLNDTEIDALELAAEDQGLPPSTLARTWILKGLGIAGPTARKTRLAALETRVSSLENSAS